MARQVELSYNDIQRIRKALHLLSNKAFEEVERVGVDAFCKSEEEKEFEDINNLYDLFYEIEEEMEEASA